MFTGRIIKRAFRLGDKKEEKKEKEKEKEETFCEQFPKLMEEQKTLGKKFRKAIKDKEPCVQMPDIVHEFVGNTGRRFGLYRSEPASQTALENGKEIDAYGFERYLEEDNSRLIDLVKKEFDGISLKEILEKAKKNDDTYDKNRGRGSLLLMVQSKEKVSFYNDLINNFIDTENQDLYGALGAFYNEENLRANIYNLMEIPFWSYFK